MPRVGRQKGVQSIEIGHNVLQALALGHGTIPLGEVARLAGMSASKAHSYLVSFIRIGMVVQDLHTGRYCLGPQALRIGLAAIAHTDVIAAARIALDTLVDEIGETAFLSVWGNHGPTVVHCVHGPNLVPHEIKVGTVMPALTTATGRVFVAFLPKAMTARVVDQEMSAFLTTSSRGTSAAFDWTLIDNVHQRGIARVPGLFAPGYVALAAPVFDHQSMVSIVVTTLGPMGRFDANFDGRIATSLSTMTQELSKSLGFAG